MLENWTMSRIHLIHKKGDPNKLHTIDQQHFWTQYTYTQEY